MRGKKLPSPGYILLVGACGVLCGCSTNVTVNKAIPPSSNIKSKALARAEVSIPEARWAVRDAIGRVGGQGIFLATVTIQCNNLRNAVSVTFTSEDWKPDGKDKKKSSGKLLNVVYSKKGVEENYFGSDRPQVESVQKQDRDLAKATAVALESSGSDFGRLKILARATKMDKKYVVMIRKLPIGLDLGRYNLTLVSSDFKVTGKIPGR